MKDASHHMRHVQKKVLQSIRKENSQSISQPQLNGNSNAKTGALGMQDKLARSTR